jgi:hypothetical protein
MVADVDVDEEASARLFDPVVRASRHYKSAVRTYANAAPPTRRREGLMRALPASHRILTRFQGPAPWPLEKCKRSFETLRRSMESRHVSIEISTPRSKLWLVGSKSRLFRGNPGVRRSIHTRYPSEWALFPSANIRDGLNNATDRRNHLLVGSKSARDGTKCKLRRSKDTVVPAKARRLPSDQSRFRAGGRRFRGKESGFGLKHVKVRTNHRRGRSNHRRIPSNDLGVQSVPSTNASK